MISNKLEYGSTNMDMIRSNGMEKMDHSSPPAGWTWPLSPWSWSFLCCSTARPGSCQSPAPWIEPGKREESLGEERYVHCTVQYKGKEHDKKTNNGLSNFTSKKVIRRWLFAALYKVWVWSYFPVILNKSWANIRNKRKLSLLKIRALTTLTVKQCTAVKNKRYRIPV